MTAAIRRAAGILAAGCLLLVPALAFPQERQAAASWQGSEFFRNLLHSFPYHCEPLQEIADLSRVDPDQTVVIVFGDNQVLDQVRQQTGGLAKYHERGGALLIASDRDDSGRLRDLKVHITGRIVLQSRERAFGREARCPLITEGLGTLHPLFEGLSEGLATNLPSYLAIDHNCDLHLLASLTGGLKAQGRPADDLPYMLGSGSDDKGRMMILAGHGVFQNQMMVNNDNFLFAINTVRWLTEGGRRKHVLFLEEGKIQTSFQVPLAQLPLPPLPRAEILDKLLYGLEKENRFNSLLLKYVNERRLWQGALLGVTLLLLLYGLRRMLLARHNLEPQLPLVSQKAALTMSAAPIHVLRREALRQGGNLWETGRDLARTCFEGHEVPGTGAYPPPFRVTGGWWQRWRLHRLVAQLWELAYGPPSGRISRRHIRRVQERVGHLSMAMEAGLVTFHAKPQATGKVIHEPHG
jgi:hypothetical protein